MHGGDDIGLVRTSFRKEARQWGLTSISSDQAAAEPRYDALVQHLENRSDRARIRGPEGQAEGLWIKMFLQKLEEEQLVTYETLTSKLPCREVMSLGSSGPRGPCQQGVLDLIAMDFKQREVLYWGYFSHTKHVLPTDCSPSAANSQACPLDMRLIFDMQFMLLGWPYSAMVQRWG